MPYLSTRDYGANGLRQVYWDETTNAPAYYNPTTDTYVPLLTGVAPPADVRTSALLPVADDVVAGAFVAIDAAGVHVANATDAAFPASGYVDATAAAPGPVRVYFDGVNTRATTVASNGPVYLATVDGACTLTPPAAPGNLVQQLGVAINVGGVTHVMFSVNAGTVVP